MTQSIKRLLFALLAIFLAYQSFKLIKLMVAVNNPSWGLSALFSCIINLVITGVFALLVFTQPIENLLPDTYYKVKNKKGLKKVYSLFKVDLFRKFLLATFWKEKDNKEKYFNGRADGLAHFTTQTKKSEFGHLFPFIIISGICILLLIKQSYKLALCTFLINFLFNWYPVLLQRFHRMRLARVYEIMKRRDARR